MIIKTLILTPNENSFAFTNKFTDNLLEKIERLKSSPVILQKLVRAKHQLRITVVGEKFFQQKLLAKANLIGEKVAR